MSKQTDVSPGLPHTQRWTLTWDGPGNADLYENLITQTSFSVYITNVWRPSLTKIISVTFLVLNRMNLIKWFCET